MWPLWGWGCWAVGLFVAAEETWKHYRLQLPQALKPDPDRVTSSAQQPQWSSVRQHLPTKWMSAFTRQMESAAWTLPATDVAWLMHVSFEAYMSQNCSAYYCLAGHTSWVMCSVAQHVVVLNARAALWQLGGCRFLSCAFKQGLPMFSYSLSFYELAAQWGE